jgi:hypothetical protein
MRGVKARYNSMVHKRKREREGERERILNPFCLRNELSEYRLAYR